MPEKPIEKVLQKKNKALEKDLSSVVHQARMSDVESRQLLQTLTEKSIVGIYVIQGGRIRFLNSNAASYAGYRVEELVGTKADMIVHPDDRDMVNKNARAMLKGEHKTPHEFRILTKAGHVRWILELVTSITYEGKPAILGNSMDLTERKDAEAQLRESEQRLADIIDFLPDATLVIDMSGKVIAWNRAMEDMTGVKAEDMLGRGNYEYAIPFYGTRRPILIDLVFKDDKKIQKKYFFVRKEGDVLLAEAAVQVKGENLSLWGKAKPLYNSKGDIIGAIESIRDITERKQVEESLKYREQELEANNIQLQDLNAALRVLLKQREQDKNDLEEKVLANVKKLIMPYLDKLKKESKCLKTMAYLGTLELTLKDIVAPFAHRISSKYVGLTNREVQVAGLIKEGMITKEIAEMLNISESAINIHRYNIRRKLGLTKKHNLHAYLSSFA
jgi:PAS domain S-box-containing protein